MGCYPPLAKIVSKALGKCNGRERWRQGKLDLDFAMAYPPGPPTETHYMPPAARTVTFANKNSVYVIPPSPPPTQHEPQPHSPGEPQQPHAPLPQAEHEPDHHDVQPQPEPAPAPEPQTQTQPDAAPPAPAPAEPKPPRGPRRGKNKRSGRVRFGPEPAPPQEQQPEHGPGPDAGSNTAPPCPGQYGHAPPCLGQSQGQYGHAPPAPQGLHLFRYTPSPLPRWEATPRRHEYFSGEYRSYYPTPVREGIYRIATDANRLTTIFSEENPNACAIV
ncbi:hypothetical protein ACP4OV_001046 [Aristida adscensionis]